MFTSQDYGGSGKVTSGWKEGSEVWNSLAGLGSSFIQAGAQSPRKKVQT